MSESLNCLLNWFIQERNDCVMLGDDSILFNFAEPLWERQNI